MLVATARSLICPPRGVIHLSFLRSSLTSASLRCIHGESHPSLLPCEFCGHKATVVCPTFPSPSLPVMPQALALSLWSTKLMWMCGAIHSQHVFPNHFLPTSVRTENCTGLKPNITHTQKSGMWDEISKNTNIHLHHTHTSMIVCVCGRLNDIWKKSDYDSQNCLYWKHLNHILSLYKNE